MPGSPTRVVGPRHPSSGPMSQKWLLSPAETDRFWDKPCPKWDNPCPKGDELRRGRAGGGMRKARPAGAGRAFGADAEE